VDKVVVDIVVTPLLDDVDDVNVVKFVSLIRDPNFRPRIRRKTASQLNAHAMTPKETRKIMRVLADDNVGLFDTGMLVIDMPGPDPGVVTDWLSVDIDVVDSSVSLDVN
jgi:hypothetical protein